MRIVSVAEVKAKFSGYLKASEEGPVIVTRNGKPVAVLLSIEDEDEIERLILAYSPKFQELLKKSKEQIREGQGIEHDRFWEEVDQDKQGKGN